MFQQSIQQDALSQSATIGIHNDDHGDSDGDDVDSGDDDDDKEENSDGDGDD